MPSDPHIVTENVSPPNCHQPLKLLLGFFVWFGFVLFGESSIYNQSFVQKHS